MNSYINITKKIQKNLDKLVEVWLVDNLDVNLVQIIYMNTYVRVIYKESGILKDVYLHL